MRKFFDAAWSQPSGDGDSPWPLFCSPYVFHGPSGCGKSSLLAAVARQHARADRRALLWTAPDLVRHVAAAIDSQTTDQLLGQLELAAAVCIDDLQWLERHDAVQEFLVSAIDRLQDRGVPMAFTLAGSESPGGAFSASSGLRESLVSRLSGGLVIPVNMPGYDVRCEILARLAMRQQLDMDSFTIELLASRFPVSASLLGRIVNTLAARRMVRGDSAIHRDDLADTAATAFAVADAGCGDADNGQAAVLEIVAAAGDHPLFAKRLVETVAARIGVTARDIYGNSRQQTTVLARGVVIWLLRHSMQWKFSRIGKLLRGKDHSTILHADRKIAARIECDSDFARLMDELLSVTGELLALCLPTEFSAGQAVFPDGNGSGKTVGLLSADVCREGPR